RRSGPPLRENPQRLSGSSGAGDVLFEHRFPGVTVRLSSVSCAGGGAAEDRDGNMPKVKQLTVWVENRPGMLGEVGSALGAKKVNIVAFMAAVTDGPDTIRMSVD